MRRLHRQTTPSRHLPLSRFTEADHHNEHGTELTPWNNPSNKDSDPDTEQRRDEETLRPATCHAGSSSILMGINGRGLLPPERLSSCVRWKKLNTPRPSSADLTARQAAPFRPTQGTPQTSKGGQTHDT